MTVVGQPTSGRRTAAETFARRDLLLSAAVFCALLYGYRAELTAMVELWNASPMYSYGYTVPVISAALLWRRRYALAAVTPKPAWLAGTIVLLGSIVVAVAGRAAGVQVLSQLAFLVSLGGSVLLLFGTRWLRVAWAPLAYLLLMVPVWDGFTEPLHAPFQLKSAETGVFLLQLLGIPAHREGVYITLPAVTLEVARACSGINYLVAVIALGLPLAYVYLPGLWRRAALLIFAVFVAGISNGLRVALIGILSYFEIGSPLHGPFHILQGLFVAGIGYVALFAGLRVLTPRGAKRAAGGDPAGAPAVRMFGPGLSSVTAVVLLIVVFVGLGSGVFARESQRMGLEPALDMFPSRLGDWTASFGTGSRAGADSRWPGADSELRRRYRRPDGASVDLYVAYFESQQQNKEIVSHRSADLHARATKIDVVEPANGNFQANYVPADGRMAATLFWYHLDAPETSRYVVKARTLLNAMSRNRSNGAVVVLTSAGKDTAQGVESLQQFGGLVEAALATRVRSARFEAGK
jgi:EpsI family protein